MVGREEKGGGREREGKGDKSVCGWVEWVGGNEMGNGRRELGRGRKEREGRRKEREGKRREHYMHQSLPAPSMG